MNSIGSLCSCARAFHPASSWMWKSCDNLLVVLLKFEEALLLLVHLRDRTASRREAFLYRSHKGRDKSFHLAAVGAQHFPYSFLVIVGAAWGHVCS